ncbi:MAG: hypothetical protein K6G06_08870 [Butyrivibrio sp.]|nr:hypothetical protein [Butyrivibrio sp.]
MKVLAIDFTGIYENEGFSFLKRNSSRSLLMKPDEKVEVNSVSFKDISGTNCICDDYACAAIKDRLVECGAAGAYIRFFDNGNYHYMSKLLIDDLFENGGFPVNLKGGFNLVVFDHHPDMKWTSYGDILSCGSWVLNTLKDRPQLDKVYIVGADKGLISEVWEEHPEFQGKVFFLESVSELEDHEGTFSRPVYLSIDKDVLSGDALATNWDQGDMSLDVFKYSLGYLKDRLGDKIMAVDVCGEVTPDDDRAFSKLGIEASDMINCMIVDIFVTN